LQLATLTKEDMAKYLGASLEDLESEYKANGNRLARVAANDPTPPAPRTAEEAELASFRLYHMAGGWWVLGSARVAACKSLRIDILWPREDNAAGSNRACTSHAR
jgi:hypothetical protein